MPAQPSASPYPQHPGGAPPQLRPEAWRGQQHDPAAYDLGSYGLPGTVPSQPRPQPPAPGHWPQGEPSHFQPQPGPRPQPPPPAPQQPQQARPAGYAGEQPPGFQVPPVQHVPASSDTADDEDLEYEDPPRRSRKWLIAAALVGSIAAGSALAYAYKIYSTPQVASKGQVVRAPREPAKVPPVERGGKQFGNVDSRLNNRVPSEGTANAGGGEIDSRGVRQVATVPVTREIGGPPPGSPPASPVPGMTIVSGGSFPSPGGVPMTAPVAEPPRAAPQPPPQRVAAPSPPPASAPVMPQPRPPQQRASPESEAAPAAQPPRTAAVPRAPDRPRPTGYVAALGYQRSQLDAMKMMADLQQKYEVLRDKKLEIVQSDESARGLGIIYRVVAGPRGSLASARELCTQLKASGMSDRGCYTMGQ